jgi:hypothetical protein
MKWVRICMIRESAVVYHGEVQKARLNWHLFGEGKGNRKH